MKMDIKPVDILLAGEIDLIKYGFSYIPHRHKLMKFIDTIHSNDPSYIKKEREKIEFEYYYTKKHLNTRSNYIKIDKNVNIDNINNSNHYDDDYEDGGDDENNYDNEKFDDDDNVVNDSKLMTLADRRTTLEIKRLEKLHQEKVPLSSLSFIIIVIIIIVD